MKILTPGAFAFVLRSVADSAEPVCVPDRRPDHTEGPHNPRARPRAVGNNSETTAPGYAAGGCERTREALQGFAGH